MLKILNDLLVSSETPDSSESSEPEHGTRSRTKLNKHASVSVRKTYGNSAATLQHPFNLKHVTQDMFSVSCESNNINVSSLLFDNVALLLLFYYL